MNKIITGISFHLKEADSEAANPVPLNHNAAHHKIAVRPKRTHGLPRRRVKQVNVFVLLNVYSFWKFQCYASGILLLSKFQAERLFLYS